MPGMGYIQGHGFFTTSRYLLGKDRKALERTLGYRDGLLDAGFDMGVLADDQVLAEDDFELMASTRHPNGKITTEDGRLVAERLDDLLEARGKSPQELRRLVAAFFARGGPNTPAKVFAHARNTTASDYVRAEAGDPGIRVGVPQFRIAANKSFRWLIVRRDPPC